MIQYFYKLFRLESVKNSMFNKFREIYQDVNSSWRNTFIWLNIIGIVAWLLILCGVPVSQAIPPFVYAIMMTISYLTALFVANSAVLFNKNKKELVGIICFSSFVLTAIIFISVFPSSNHPMVIYRIRFFENWANFVFIVYMALYSLIMSFKFIIVDND